MALDASGGAHRAPVPDATAPGTAASGATASGHRLAQDAEAVTATVMAASRLVVALSARALAEVDGSMTLPQLRALVVLDGCGPVKLVALATTLGVNPSTAMRMVDRLESVGFIDRRINPDNRREVVLRLTDSGADLVHRVLGHRHREVAALVSRLPADLRAGLVTGLRALTEAAAEPGLEPGLAPEPAPGGAGTARDVLTGGPTF